MHANPGGPRHASAPCVCAPYDNPIVPTLPLHQGCWTSHSSMSYPSSASFRYLWNSPSELYRPRQSCMTTANPWRAKYFAISARLAGLGSATLTSDRLIPRLSYGVRSMITGNGITASSPASAGRTMSVASLTPSRIGTMTSRSTVNLTCSVTSFTVTNQCCHGSKVDGDGDREQRDRDYDVSDPQAKDKSRPLDPADLCCRQIREQCA